MRTIVADAELVARCGLYCGACKSYLNGRCDGCKKNDSATWCGVRKCCAESNFLSWADCKTYTNPRDCGKFHNFISRIIGFFLRSDRRACIDQIRKLGLKGHAEDMAAQKRHTIPPG